MLEAINQINDSNFEAALHAWREVVGEEFVSVTSGDLQYYGMTCRPSANAVEGVIWPSSVDELCRVVAIARRFAISLYPISRGKNWGYGAATPSAPNCVVLDLSRMRRIIEVNERLAYAVVEPGVTQQQLYDYLKEQNLALDFDVTGASPQASLVGNLLERGYGQTPYSDHYLHSAGMEVLLADGRVFSTGFGHYAQAKTRYLHKWGIGPAIDGLFTQSNYGIVTKVGVWLMPRAEYFGVFRMKFRDDRHLALGLEKLRELKLRGVLSSAIHIANDVRVLSSVQQYPWREAATTPLPDALLSDLRRRWDLGVWNAGGGLRGSRREVMTALAEVRRAFRGTASVSFVSERKVQFARRFSKLYNKLTGADLEQKLSIFGLMRGIPTERPTIGTYWRKPEPPPQADYDPLRDKCGVIWCSPIIPTTAEDFLIFIKATHDVCRRFNFETNVTLGLISDRSASCVVGIVFDKNNASETELAAQCHEELLQAYFDAGYIPYRFASSTSTKVALFESEDPYWQVCRQIKDTLDPQRIISPGRYGIS